MFIFSRERNVTSIGSIIFFLICVLPGHLFAQPGVHFESGSTWEQLKEKAKAENKYLFVDCYASWCGPCNKMDTEVYPDTSVGAYLNNQFISVKVQMDTTKQDDAIKQSWYSDAHALSVNYKINAFPCYLFFTPDGIIVHRGLGYQDPAAFIGLVKNALDPQKQYYTMLDNYKAGIKSYEMLPYLAERAKAFNDRGAADSMMVDYMHSYLDTQGEAAVCTRENLRLAASFAIILSSGDKIFQICLRNPRLADSAMHNKGFAKRLVNFVIGKEEIDPETALARKETREPNWKKIDQHIRGKYGKSYAEENVAGGKIDWYRSVKNWSNYAKYLVIQMDMTGLASRPNDPGERFVLNNIAWEVFKYSNDKNELERAVAWSDWVVQGDSIPDGVHIDTKANLLYKLGRKDEALSLEVKAVEASPKIEVLAKEIAENLEKMKQGEPTWPMR